MDDDLYLALLGALQNTPDWGRKKLAELYGIDDESPERLALVRWAQIRKEIDERKEDRRARMAREFGASGLRARYEALKRAAGQCQLCGRGRKEGAVLHVDHIKPIATHPELIGDPDNLQVLCDDCNNGKGGWDETDWR